MALLGSSGILGISQRTSVLYDFSIVKKARFYVFTGAAAGLGGSQWTPTSEILYAQINPSSISANSGSRRKNARVALAPGAKRNSHIDWSNDSDTLDLSLRYDVYDEYMVGTADGMLQGITTDMDLSSPRVTSLQKFLEYSKNDNVALLFKWGSFSYFGKVQNASFTYTAFSRFGFPLKADGSVVLARTGGTLLGSGETQEAENSDLTVAGFASGLEAADKAEDLVLRAEIGATLASR